MTFDDDLPELGTKAAAVESCASLIFYAVNGDGTVNGEQLRYWLDLYYQVRFAYERERQEERLSFGVYTRECKPERDQRADEGIGPYKGTEISAEDVDRSRDLDEALHKVLVDQARRAGIEVEETDCHVADAPRNDNAEVGDGADEGSPSAVSAPP